MKRFTRSYVITLAIVWLVCLGGATFLRAIFIAFVNPRLTGSSPLVFATALVLGIVAAHMSSDLRRGGPDPRP